MAEKKKNPNAVALGRLGGAAKVPKGMAVLSEEQKREISMAGVRARQKKAKKRVNAKAKTKAAGQ